MSHLLYACVALAIVGQEPEKPAELPNSPVFKVRDAKFTPLGRNLWLETTSKGRRVIVRSIVCRQKAALEEFMCLKGTKEHEAIVAADIPPRSFHAALLAAGAKPGSVATFQGEFRPPTGDKLEISLEWKDGKEFKHARAQDWIRDSKTQKAIAFDFVFAGSQEIENPVTKERIYLGNEGDLVSVSNFPSSIVDLAAQSSSSNEELLFETFTERIPAVDTEVIVVFNPAASRPEKTKSANKPQ